MTLAIGYIEYEFQTRIDPELIVENTAYQLGRIYAQAQLNELYEDREMKVC